jgi:hypothetical protein
MRNQFNEQDEKTLLESSNRIKDFTDFGLEVWINRLQQYENNTLDMPSNLLFRQILEAGDGIFELVKNGCINASKPLIRMALDCYLQLAFLLEKENEKRALHFLYHYNRNRLYYLERILKPENENSLANKLVTDDIMNEFSLTDEEKEMASVDYNTLQEILNSNENAEVAKEYGMKRRQAWYQVFIKSSKIEDLAKSLKRSAMYEIIFRNLSSFIHGEDIIHSNVIFYPNELVGLKNLRDATQLNFIVSNTIIILRKSILLFIQAKMNSEMELILKLKSIHEKKADL